VLITATMAVGATLVALVLLPLFGALGMGANALNDRLDQAGADFTRVPHFPERSTIYAKDGSVLQTIYLDENREIVHFDKIAPIARESVLAIEDDGFYQHGALNVPSVIRALIANLAAGQITQGGSTITQQLVKQAVIGDTAQTFARKFQEAALAIRLEETYSKDQILAMYLNEVYLGNGVYGIGTAARYYFGEPAKKLDLTQSALLAALIRAPGYYDPVVHPDHALNRRNDVLDHLAELGWVSQKRIDKAKQQPIALVPDVGQTKTKVPPFFVHFLTQSILDVNNREYDAFGTTYAQRLHTLYQGGLKIYTTLDPAWQQDAQDAVDASPNISKKGGPDVSLVSVDAKTGAIRAMLSGKDYKRDQLDLAWHGIRQVGSAFKPYTLVAAFENGIPPGKVYSGQSPFCSPLWISADHCVHNAEGSGGYMNLWTATQDSVNVVFAQLALDVGAENIVTAAHQMGITSPLDAVPAITLGVEEVSTLDMASGYSTLANDGIHCKPFAIARVMLPNGNKLYQHKNNCKQVIDPGIAHLVTAMLERVISSGTGTAAIIPGRPLAGKTGTGQDYNNVYFAGYTPQVSTAVWVGFPQGNIPMDSYYGHSVFGGTLAAPIWRAFMVKALVGVPVEGFEAPPAPEHGKVPDVVGLKSDEAQTALVDANFTPIVEKTPSSQALNTVIGQTPGGGANVVLGSAVHIQVSNGQLEAVTVPRVVGLTQDNAVNALDKAGLIANVQFVEVTDKHQEGVVLSQVPIGNKQVDPGSTVTIMVGQKGAPAPTPSPSPSPSSGPGG
jgi:membrane peptidoglycan carboxypeptidase